MQATLLVVTYLYWEKLHPFYRKPHIHRSKLRTMLKGECEWHTKPLLYKLLTGFLIMTQDREFQFLGLCSLEEYL